MEGPIFPRTNDDRILLHRAAVETRDQMLKLLKFGSAKTAYFLRTIKTTFQATHAHILQQEMRPKNIQ